MIAARLAANRGERDHRHAGTQLKPASRGVEREHRSRNRRQSPLTDDPTQPPMQRAGEVLQGDVGHREQHPGGDAKKQSPRGGAETVTHRDPDQRGTERKDTALHRDQHRQRIVTQRAGIDPSVTAITASPNAVTITPAHCRQPR